MAYFGLVQIDATAHGTQLTRNTANTPRDADTPPTYRTYGPSGIMANGTGTLSSKDPSSSGGTITGATNATPIVITSVAHGLNSGTRIKVASVGGNTAANADWVITVVDADMFSLNSSVGNGAYTSGGNWHTVGVYDITISPTTANGYVVGTTYQILVSWVMNSVSMAEMHTFTVV